MFGVCLSARFVFIFQHLLVHIFDSNAWLFGNVVELSASRFDKGTFCPSCKAVLHGAIFLATCNAILFLSDVNK